MATKKPAAGIVLFETSSCIKLLFSSLSSSDNCYETCRKPWPGSVVRTLTAICRHLELLIGALDIGVVAFSMLPMGLGEKRGEGELEARPDRFRIPLSSISSTMKVESDRVNPLQASSSTHFPGRPGALARVPYRHSATSLRPWAPEMMIITHANG